MEVGPEKKSKGRQKIEMELIECDNARAVTFSKRKRSLFEKAKRFSSSTGATIGIFFISSKGFIHAFGTSCVHSIINAYRVWRTNERDGQNPNSAAVEITQNHQHTDMQLDLDGDPVEKLKAILESQDVSSLIGSFDSSNLEHVEAAYAWFDECCKTVQGRIEELCALSFSANAVGDFDLNVAAIAKCIPSSEFDLNVTASAYQRLISAPSSSANPISGFNLNVTPSADDEEMTYATNRVGSFNLNVAPSADDEEMIHVSS